MSIDESIKNAKDGLAVVGEMLKIAGDNPNVKEAGNNIGQTALTITKTINNALLPLAAVNFAFDKARIYFAEKFQQDILQKASTIPPEQIIEPKASIAGPTLQGLAFTHEEVNLKDMYLSLLATAMDGRVAAEAHPAFVEIIKQLNSEEADLIRGVLQSPRAIPIIEVRFTKAGENNSWTTLATHILDLTESEDSEPGRPVENPRISAMVDNWIRLGLVHVDYTKHLTAAESYAWADKRPEVIRYRKKYESETQKISSADGILIRTALGTQFANAVGLA
jgi:Abortive infection alpha